MEGPGPTLLVMAAGLGSRFGGLKQLEGVGPAGELLLDYSVFDGARAGIRQVVLVVRRETAADFRAAFGSRFAGVDVELAFQELDDVPDSFAVPAARRKPWGTAHAVLAARERIAGPFVVINADDYYGPEGFARLAGFLSRPAVAGPEAYAMVGFRLRNTLSPYGPVSRGVCTTSPDGLLRDVVELARIEAGPDGTVRAGAAPATAPLSGDELVSMNLWGFRSGLFAQLGSRFRRFLDLRGSDPGAEFQLPAEVGALVEEGLATVRVLETSWPWFGLTYPEDLEEVRRRIRELVSRGVYPEPLWG